MRRAARKPKMELRVNDLHLPVDLEGQVRQLIGIRAEQERLAVQLPLRLREELDPEVFEQLLCLIAADATCLQVRHEEPVVELIEAPHGAHRIAVLHVLKLVVQVRELQRLVESPRGAFRKRTNGRAGQRLGERRARAMAPSYTRATASWKTPDRASARSRSPVSLCSRRLPQSGHVCPVSRPAVHAPGTPGGSPANSRLSSSRRQSSRRATSRLWCSSLSAK